MKTSQTNPLTPEREALYLVFDCLFGKCVHRNARNTEAIDHFIGIAATPEQIAQVFQTLYDDPENNHWWRNNHITIPAIANQFATRMLTLDCCASIPSNGYASMTPEQRLEYDLAQYNRNRVKQKKPELTLDEFRQLLASMSGSPDKARHTGRAQDSPGACSAVSRTAQASMPGHPPDGQQSASDCARRAGGTPAKPV